MNLPTLFQKQSKRFVAGLCASAVALAAAGPVMVLGSSHREAPLISADPQADNTDVYAFVSPDKTDSVTLIASFNPFQEPAGGPNFFSFGDDVHYDINVDNNGDALADITYRFDFATETRNKNTFLYNTATIDSLQDPDWNVRQTYTLSKIQNGVTTVIGSNLLTPPVNIGPKSTPNYAALSNAAIQTLGNMKVFAGQTDDAFFVDLGGTFDLLTIRKLPGNTGGGVDGLKGYNTLSLALQIPKSELSNNGSAPADMNSTNAIVGVWSTTSRQSTSVLQTTGARPTVSGDWVQVSRLGAPLVNEVVISLDKKDVWNSSKPQGDAQFANFVTNPELGVLLNAIYGIKVPPQGNFGSTTQRDDLIAIFLTGIPGVNKPATVTPSEMLRLNMGIAPASNPNSLGVVGGDNAGYPNGRRLADDVTDISLKAVAGAAYPLFHPDYTPDPLASKLGDGVDTNDVAFRSSFPYLALPHQGLDSRPHGAVTGGNSSSLDARERELNEREADLDDREDDLDMREDDLDDDDNNNDEEFSDIGSGETAGAIEFLRDMGVVSGYSDGTFRPNTLINRAEFVKIVLAAKYDDSEISGSNCFSDVPRDDWYERYVCKANSVGIVKGYGNGMFRPNSVITAEEAYKVVTEVFFPSAVSGTSNPWYSQYVKAAQENWFYSSDLRVGQSVNRGEMALILALALGYNR